MKRILFVFMALALTFALVNPVFAANGPNGGIKNGTFTLTGKISALDAAAQTITVQVAGGNALVRSYVTKNLTVNTTSTTRFLAKSGTIVTVITFADLKVGDSVSISGKTASSVWTAARVTVGASLIHVQ